MPVVAGMGLAHEMLEGLQNAVKLDSPSTRPMRLLSQNRFCFLPVVQLIRCALCFTLALAATTPAYAQQPDVIPGIGTVAKEMPKDL
mgnify:CR=1 FL=1